MSYQQILVPRLGALRLDADPSDLGFDGAASVSNVEFDPNGTVRTRPGFDKTDAGTLSGNPTWLVPYRHGSQFVLVGGNATGTSLRGYNSSFASIDTATTLFATTAIPSHAIEHGIAGVPDVSWVFVTWPGATNGIGMWNGIGTWTGVATTYAVGKFLAVTPWDDRLVMLRSSEAAGTTQEDSLVRFSDPSAALNFTADNWVEVSPTDGQKLRMGVPWRDLLFVFKETKFFVFYGTSTDSTGGALFNYRTVDTGVGCGYDYAAAAAQDGVYFVHADGIYRTTGGPPELVSAPLQPFFDARTNGIFTPTGPLTSPRIHAGDDRLYVWQQGATGMFVMDFRTRVWTYWVLSVAPYALLPLDDPREFLFADSTGQLYHSESSFSDDDGTAIASHWQSGFTSLAKGLPATVRRYEVTGSGTVTHTLYGDQSTVAEWQGTAATSVAMGTAPVIEREYALQSGRARDLAFKISATSGAWVVSRWAALVSAVRSY